MKIVKVTYTAKAEYAEENQNNIKNVMADLRKLNDPGLNYHVCLGLRTECGYGLRDGNHLFPLPQQVSRQ